MKELKDIVQAYEVAQNQGIKTALATVVYVEGSSYRRAGARMLIAEDGQLTGAISGGCLEGDALRKARLVMIQKKSMLVMYDTTDEDDAKLGVQLGCNGIIHILIEPLLSDRPDNPIHMFTRFLDKREKAAVITIFNMEDRFSPQFGTCYFTTEYGESLGKIPDMISLFIINEAISVIKYGSAADKVYSYWDNFTCFVELLLPNVELVIIGAGNDAIPLVQMAKLLGWHITVVDGRPNYNTPHRFPTADKQVTGKPDHIFAQLKPDNRTVFMLMTHNYNYDLALIKLLMPLQVPYIGILGPKKRLNKMLDEIGGPSLVANKPEYIHGPAGLDIGSENPEQIALSILCEIQAVLNGLNAAPLKNKVVIHNRDNEYRMIHPSSPA